MLTKICSSCKKEKPTEFFNFKNKSKGTLHHSCKSCSREHSKTYYKKNIKAHVLRADNSRKNKNKKFQEFKKQLKCHFCSETEPCCLQFHHVDPTLKEFAISQLQSYSWKRIMQEINKCIVVCANCHAKIHAGKINMPTSHSGECT